MEIIFALFGFAFACVGLFFAGTALLGMIRSAASRNWYPVPGRILSSEVAADIASGSSPVGANYNARIRYEYEVNGRQFTGENVDFSRFRTNTPGQAARTVRNYPAGAAVTVYHHPLRPERAALEPGRIGVHMSGLLVGGAVMLFGILFGFGGLLGFDVFIDKLGTRLGIDEDFVWRYFPPFIVVVGAGIAAAGVLAGLRSRKTAQWPTTEGTIIASGIVRESSSSTNTTVSTGGSVYKPEVAYRYEVGGKEYVSNRIELMDISTSNRGRAESIGSAYNTGDRVRVYYDPGNPERAVLQPGGKSGSCLMIVVGAGFVIIASIIMWFHSIVAQ